MTIQGLWVLSYTLLADRKWYIFFEETEYPAEEKSTNKKIREKELLVSMEACPGSILAKNPSKSTQSTNFNKQKKLMSPLIEIKRKKFMPWQC